jgi:hypothetical protein
LVYDLMEPHRPQVDRQVLDFVRSNAFTPRDFIIDSKGVCRLHPQLAKTLIDRVSGAMSDLLVGAGVGLWLQSKDSSDDLLRGKA